MSDEKQRTHIGIDFGAGDYAAAAVVYPDGKVLTISIDRLELLQAEAAADRFDGLGTPMVDFYKP